MTLKDISKFVERGIENKQIIPLRLNEKKEKHVNVLDPRNDVLENFLRSVSIHEKIIIIFRLTNKIMVIVIIFFFFKCLHYFSTNEKLQSHVTARRSTTSLSDCRDCKRQVARI